MFNILKNLKSKITLANWLFIIPAIIHFLLVCFVQYKMNDLNVREFSQNQFITFIIIKIIVFILLITFYQIIWIIIKGFKNNNSTIKQITKYFLIYFIPNLILLFLMWPGIYDWEYISNLEYIVTFNFHIFNQFLQCFYIMIAYNCLPSIWGISLSNIIVFSFITTFAIYGYKTLFNNRYAWIIYIPFFFPMIIGLNTLSIRLINCSYFAVLVFCFLLFLYKTKEKTNNNTYITILLAILLGLFCSSRPEFIILIIIFPLMIYFLKLFNFRKYFVFTFIFFITAFAVIIYEENRFGLNYEMHNILIKYNRICNLPNLYYMPNEEIEVLKENDIYCQCGDWSYEIEPDKAQKLRKILSKYIILNSPIHININISDFLDNKTNYIVYPDFNTSEYFQELPNNKDFYPLYIRNSKMFNEKLRYKTLSLLSTGTFDFGYGVINTKFANPLIVFSLLPIILFLGIIIKNYFYIWFFICWLFVLIILFIAMPFKYYFYIYPFTICTYCIFMTLIAELCKIIIKKHNIICPNKFLR